MKKRILSVFLIMILLVSSISVVSFANSIENEKNLMEKYIRMLLNEKISEGKYLPFAEYNELLEEQYSTVDWEEFSQNFILDQLDWDLIAKSMLEVTGTKVYAKEQYKRIFADIIEKVGSIEKNVNADIIQKEVENIQEMLKYYDDVNDLLEDVDENDIQIAAYMEFDRSYKSLFEKDVLGIDIDNDSISGEYGLANDILNIFSVAIRDYKASSEYLEILKEMVYEISDNMYDKANADAMRNAFNEVYLAYHDKVTASFAEFSSQVSDRLKGLAEKQYKELLKLRLSEIGLGVVAEKFLIAADIALFVKDVAMISNGSQKEVDSILYLGYSTGLTHVLQQYFVNIGYQALQDNSFTDNEFYALRKVFNICKAIQSLNYEYIDYIDIDGFTYNIHIAGGLSNDKVGFIADKLSNEYLLSRYLKYAEQRKIMDYADGGQCGETMYWEIDNNGNLLIFGSGDMYHTTYANTDIIRAGFPVGSKKWTPAQVVSVEFEGNITGIGNDAFGGMPGTYTSDDRHINLKRVEFPDTLVTISNYAFLNCINLESIKLPSNLKYIGLSAFSGCTKLKNINLPDSLIYIGQNAFGETSLNDGINLIPKNITELESSMFNNTNITELVIPENITKIKANFFADFKSLKTVYMLTKHDVFEVGLSDLQGGYSFVVYGYENAKEWVDNMNKPNTYWPKVSSIVYRELTPDIIIPGRETDDNYYENTDSSGQIEKSGTCGDNLTWTLDSNGTLKISGSGEMNNDSVYITPWGEIDDNIKSVVIGNGVKSIGNSAFRYCESLESITIPDSVTSIGKFAFDGCKSLTSITIPDSVIDIGDNAFDGCKSLTSITIPDSVTNIGYDAFRSCESLKSITIPDRIAYIRKCTFYGCESLTSIIIPDGVIDIGDGAFGYCKRLTSITIPDSVTNIGYGSVYGCESLKDVYYKGTVAQWGNIAIRGNNGDYLTNAKIHFSSDGSIPIGTVVGQALKTDIKATINGYDIPSFNVDGYTYVIVEDLRYYGFDVTYDDSMRALSVERNNSMQWVSKSYTKPYVSPSQVGQPEHNLLYTDIKAFLNGQYTESYNINGQTIIRFDALTQYGNVAYDNNIREISLKIDGLNSRYYKQA